MHRPNLFLLLKEQYLKLDKEWLVGEVGQPIFFDYDHHPIELFANRMQLFHFIQELELTVSIDIVSFRPGVSTFIIVVLVYVSRKNRPVPEMLIDGFSLVHDIGPNMSFIQDQ